MNADNEVTSHRSEILPRSEISNRFEFTSGLMSHALKSALFILISLWLVGKAVFSETGIRIFLIFCRKLGDYCRFSYAGNWELAKLIVGTKFGEDFI